jgi:Fe-S-cluster containining protein
MKAAVDLGRFECKRCGACCRIAGFVRLQGEDSARIAAHLNMDEGEFLEQFASLHPDRLSLVLNDRGDGACSMLTEDNRCRIYPVRPKLCRTFPHEWVNVNSSEYCPALAELEVSSESRENLELR